MGGLRLALRRMIRHFVLHPAALLGWLAALIVVVAVVVLVPVLGASIPGLPQIKSQQAPSATEDYLRGNRDYNANLVWGSLDSDAQARLTSQGGSVDGLQRQMQAAKDQGIQLADISYIGGKSMPDGTSMQFYLVGIKQQNRSDLDYQPYMFTLDRDGKIAKVQ